MFAVSRVQRIAILALIGGLSTAAGGCAGDPTTPVGVNNPPPTPKVPTEVKSFWHAFVYTPREGVIAIPELPGTTESSSSSINDAGDVVGYMRVGTVAHAFLWSKTGGTLDLGTLSDGKQSDFGSYAASINAKGQVAGWSKTTGGSVHAFRWSRATGMVDLGVPPGALDSRGAGINAKGDVVGQVWSSEGGYAFKWTESGGMQNAGVIPAEFSTGAVDINDDGYIIGTLVEENGPNSESVGAIAWTPSGAILNIAGCANGAPCGLLFSAINASGEVVGRSVGPESFAFRWSRADGLVVLPGTQVRFRTSGASAINDAGDIVGWLMDGSVSEIVLWAGTNEPFSIPQLRGSTATKVTAINNNRQVAGSALIPAPGY